MWELDHKESWAPKDWCFWTMVLGKTLESPLDSKEIKPVNPKGNWPWVFTGRNWSWSSNTSATWWEELTHWKRPWCWEDCRQEEKGDDRGWDGWMASPTQWTWVLSKLQELVMDTEAWHDTVHGVAKTRTGLRDWTELNILAELIYSNNLQEWFKYASSVYPGEDNQILHPFFCISLPPCIYPFCYQ